MSIRKLLPLGALALATLVAGCRGPELIVRNIQGEPGKVYFRGLRDSFNNELRKDAPEQPIGDLPTEWPIPEPLLGGQGYIHVVFGDGSEQIVYSCVLRSSSDTVVDVPKPPSVH